MLLVIDVGNTNTVLGLYRGDELMRDWRLATDESRIVRLVEVAFYRHRRCDYFLCCSANA